MDILKELFKQGDVFTYLTGQCGVARFKKKKKLRGLSGITPRFYYFLYFV